MRVVEPRPALPRLGFGTHFRTSCIRKEASMTPQEKALLTEGFEVLGPERVARGLSATGHSWSDCFLAMAISGEPGALVRELQTHWRKHYYVGTRIGTRAQVVNEIVKTWDHEEKAFRTLAAEWLELNRTTPRRAPLVADAVQVRE